MRIAVILSMLTLSLWAQGQKNLDTIYANEREVVALFFPETIRQGIVGQSNYKFSFNQTQEQHFALLQATPGTGSNLLTITSDGRVYSYMLEYAEKLPKRNYFIKTEASIGFEKPVSTEKVITKKENSYKNRSTYFEKFSKYLLKLPPKRLARKKVKGLKMRVEQKVYEQSELYMVLSLENNSEMDFEVGDVRIFLKNSVRGKKASHQELEQDIVYKYKLPEVVKKGVKERMVLMIPKNVPGFKEQWVVKVREKNGNRSMFLKFK